METKTGRPRRFDFADQVGGADPETRWLVGLLLELGERMLDQVEHLPAAVLHSAPGPSYLTPARLVLHCVGSELRLLRPILAPFTEPPYAALVTRSTSEDLTSMVTDGVDAVGILRSHLGFRRELLGRAAEEPGFLNLPVDHPSFPDKRGVLGHLVWHWSFHSGHIGAVTLEMGHEYQWTSAPKVQR